MWIKYIADASLVFLVITSLISKFGNGAFRSLGLVMGLGLGLSASPVLAATVSALFTLAGILIPIYLRPPSEQPAPHAPPWLFPLAGWLAVGLIYGVFLRANDTLNFSDNLRTHYLAQGFTQSQVDSIMAGQAAELAKQSPAPTIGDSRTTLQSDRRNATWAKLLEDLVRPGDTPEKNLDRVKKAVTPADLEQIHWLESRGTTPSQVLEILKSWHVEKESGETKS